MGKGDQNDSILIKTKINKKNKGKKWIELNKGQNRTEPNKGQNRIEQNQTGFDSIGLTFFFTILKIKVSTFVKSLLNFCNLLLIINVIGFK